MKPAYAIGKVIQFGFPLFWLFCVERAAVPSIRPRRHGVGMGLAFGMIVSAAAIAVYYGILRSSAIFQSAPSELSRRLAAIGIDQPVEFLLLGVFYSLLHSLLEEYYWRWFVFGRLRLLIGVRYAIVLSSLAFMAHHVVIVGAFLDGFGVVTWLFSFCVAVGGAVWAWLYERTGTLYGPWASHALIDAALMWIGYDLWR